MIFYLLKLEVFLVITYAWPSFYFPRQLHNCVDKTTLQIRHTYQFKTLFTNSPIFLKKEEAQNGSFTSHYLPMHDVNSCSFKKYCFFFWNIILQFGM